MLANLVQANLFQLHGNLIQVNYSDTSILGGSILTYCDTTFNLTFRGEEIEIQETSLGQLITVTLENIPDLQTVTFTLILPSVNLNSESPQVDLQVPGIITRSLTTIAGPGLGAEKTYSLISLAGNAQFIVS